MSGKIDNQCGKEGRKPAIYDILKLQKSPKKEHWATSFRWLVLYGFRVILKQRKVELAH